MVSEAYSQQSRKINTETNRTIIERVGDQTMDGGGGEKVGGGEVGGKLHGLLVQTGVVLLTEMALRRKLRPEQPLTT